MEKENLARLGAELSTDSYDHIFRVPVKLLDEKKPFRKVVGYGVTRNEVEGFTGHYDNYFVISFQGSWDISDWYQNFQFLPRSVVPYSESGGNSNYKIHSGMYSQYMVIRDELHERVKSVGTSDLKIITCGHSLGGALANLAALDLQFNFDLKEDEIFNVTIGAPRFGNSEFVKSYNNRVPNSYRFTRCGDPIPVIPNPFYVHLGKHQHFGFKYFVPNIFEHIPSRYIEDMDKLGFSL